MSHLPCHRVVGLYGEFLLSKSCRLCSVSHRDVNIPEKPPSTLSSWREVAKLTMSELRAPTV